MPIVEAVAVGVSRAGTFSQTARTRVLRDAMSAAVTKAFADGVTDQEQVRARMLDAYALAAEELDGTSKGNLER